MKYSTSNIMKSAHGYVRAGLSIKTAMVRAWAEAKLDNLAQERFYWLDTKDRWNNNDYAMHLACIREEAMLRRRITKTPAEIKAERDAMAQAAAEWQREEQIRLDNADAQQASWHAYQEAKLSRIFA